jgi:hypothetical protein
MTPDTRRSALYELCNTGRAEEVEERLGLNGENADEIIKEVNRRSNVLSDWDGEITSAKECLSVAGLLCDENRE